MRKTEGQITTIIGMGSECNGDFASNSSIRVDGVINGNVMVKGSLIVGASGAINGNVQASVVIVGGEINGNIQAPERTELTSTARVIGDIYTSVIVIDEKAIFQGGCNMNLEGSERRGKPAGRAVKEDKRTARATIEEALRDVNGTGEGTSYIGEN